MCVPEGRDQEFLLSLLWNDEFDTNVLDSLI